MSLLVLERKRDIEVVKSIFKIVAVVDRVYLINNTEEIQLSN